MEFYLQIGDTCEELGITRRQLSYWETCGLFTPMRHGKYTVPEIDRLHYLKVLIVDLELPVKFVQKLLDDPESVLFFLRSIVTPSANEA